MSIALAVVRAMRPHQWVKNAFVAAPAVFAAPVLVKTEQWTTERMLAVLAATLGFCLASRWKTRLEFS